MKRFFLLFFVLVFCGLRLLAADETVCLTLTTTSGEEVYFGLSSRPVITYGASTISVVSAEYSIEDFSLDDLEMYYFSRAVPNGIASVPLSPDGKPSVAVEEGSAVVAGLSAGAQVAVYTPSGQAVATVRAAADGTASIDLTALPSGAVYVLRTPTTSFKIVK